MSQYYYTVASLPELQFEEQSSISLDGFVDACQVELSVQDMNYVNAATLGSAGLQAVREADSPGGVLREWQRRIREFAEQLALLRAQHLGWELDRLPRPDAVDAALPERLRQITGEENALKREIALLKWQWALANELEAGHFFDRDKLALYHIKLQIVLRRSRILDNEMGDKEFEQQYTKVAESLMEIAR